MHKQYIGAFRRRTRRAFRQHTNIGRLIGIPKENDCAPRVNTRTSCLAPIWVAVGGTRASCYGLFFFFLFFLFLFFFAKLWAVLGLGRGLSYWRSGRPDARYLEVYLALLVIQTLTTGRMVYDMVR